MIDASLGKVYRDARCDAYSGGWCTCHVMNRHYRINGWKYCGIVVVSKHAVDRRAYIDRNLRSRGLADMVFAGTDRIASCSPILLRLPCGCRAAVFGDRLRLLRTRTACSVKHVAEVAETASIACLMHVAGEALQRGPCLRMSEHD
jgi:hypothetical protein